MSVPTATTHALVKTDELTERCVKLVRLIEELILGRAPKFFRPRGLTPKERQAFAEHLLAVLKLLVTPEEQW